MSNQDNGYLPKRSFPLEVGECRAVLDQRNLGDRQDLFVLVKVLTYLKMGHLITFTEKLLHDLTKDQSFISKEDSNRWIARLLSDV